MTVNEEIVTRLRRAWRIATGVRLATAAVLVAPGWFAAPVAVTAQGRDGLYLRADFGDSDALTFRGSFKGVDLPTRCDRLLHSDPTTVPPDPACTGFGSNVFATVRFDRGAETMTSATALALGYARGGVDPATGTAVPAWQTRAAGTADCTLPRCPEARPLGFTAKPCTGAGGRWEARNPGSGAR